MAVDKKTVAAAIVGLVSVAAVVLFVGKIRADRADDRMDEVFDKAEIEQAAVLRETFGPWIREIDEGQFGEPVRETIQGLREDSRYEQACDRLIEIEQQLFDDINDSSGWRIESLRRRAEIHDRFRGTISLFSVYAALYDQGMVNEPPPSVPYSNADRGAFDVDDRIVESDGLLDGLTVFTAKSRVVPLTVISSWCLASVESNGRLQQSRLSTLSD